MIRRILRKEIEKAIEKLFGTRIDFNISSAGKHGDYAVNAAIILNTLNSYKIAEKIKEELANSQIIKDYFSEIRCPQPPAKAFLNFVLSEKGLEESLKFLKKKKINFGGNKKIQVEFISANPTGLLHIGHGRSAFYGDALSNVLEAAGYRVEREYFINDAKISAQIRELGKTALGQGITYLTPYLKSQIKKIKPELRKNADEGKAGYLLAREIQKDNKKFIEKELGIKLDLWVSENKFYEKGEAEKIKAMLKSKKLIYEKDGAIWLKTSEHGDDEDRVIVRSNATPTYFFSDIVYHLNKFKRKYKKIIDIWGADHQGHIKRMLAVKNALGWKGDLEILTCQLVTIKESGAKKKLSKRKGDVILLEKLLKEVGLDVLRWFFLEKALSTQMEFNLDLAKEQSKKNPVYYVQYAYARMASILRKSKEKPKSRIEIKNLIKPAEISLLKKLIQFPEIIEDTARDYQIHHLTTYLYELAQIFTEFYESMPVLTAETEELRKARLALVFASQNILGRGLNLLGISAPKRM